VGDPRAWLSDVAAEEDWNEATLPRISRTLDELGIEVEEREDGKICIRDDRECEPVRPGHKLTAIQKLVEGEKERRRRQKRKDAKAKLVAQELKRRESRPRPPQPNG
jgi:hypothetical protein